MFLRFRSPNQSGIRSFISRSTFGSKEKEEGFPKGGTLVHLFGSVPKARPAETIGSIKQTRREKTTSTTFNITCRRATRVYSRTTERV